MTLTPTKLILLVSCFFVTFCNWTFFKKVVTVYPISLSSSLFLLSIGLLLLSSLNLILNIIQTKYTLKPILMILFIITAITSYFMDTYGVVMDESMIVNILKTNLKETIDLFSIRLFIYLFFLGIVPAYLLTKVKLKYEGTKSSLMARLKAITISLLVAVILLLIFGKNYASFFREQKSLRYYTNPTYYIYSASKYVSNKISSPKMAFKQIGTDAIIPETDKRRELIIFVVGETARADRFSINGYEKETNPELKKEHVISFSNMESCGTSTAISVPCMFSDLTRKGFSLEKVAAEENLLDVLLHTKKINILWRDNNSNSQGVANRIPNYQGYQSPNTNTICNPECRDEGMLVGLPEYIKKNPEGDFFIVLHQLGNHGPAYYQRYPKEFEKFQPVCKTNELEKCTNEEISNAYDNAILYTDYFLAKIIKMLKENFDDFDTALVYVSDHGESLGENGIYLHSLPYFMAPKEQKQVAAIMWFGTNITEELNMAGLKERAKLPASHDYVFHTILGLFEIKSSIYNENLDLLHTIFHHLAL